MKKKDKVRRTVREDIIEDEGSTYEYSLLISTSAQVASYGFSLYSIRIKMTDADGRITEKETGDIFADFGKAIVFYERMRDNLATPLNLAYVLEDAITI